MSRGYPAAVDVAGAFFFFMVVLSTAAPARSHRLSRTQLTDTTHPVLLLRATSWSISVNLSAARPRRREQCSRGDCPPHETRACPVSRHIAQVGQARLAAG